MQSRNVEIAEQVKGLTDKLEAGVKGVFESEQYIAYMKAMSKFHQYSFNNVMLILMQCPDATAVAGFHTWTKQFGRTVKKGEHGIQILAPTPHKLLAERNKLDPDTMKPIIGADGKPETESVFVVYQSYRVAYVFDVSQTEGRELPSYGVDELTGDVAHFDSLLKAVTESAPVPVVMREPEKSKGCYRHKDQKIYLNDGMSQIDTISVLIHETAHAKLHALPVKDGMVDGKPEKDRHTREVEAESIAYIVCQHFGIETDESAFAYIAGWSSSKELDELKASLDCISKTSAETIDQIESRLPELNKAREKTPVQEKCVSR